MTFSGLMPRLVGLDTNKLVAYSFEDHTITVWFAHSRTGEITSKTLIVDDLVAEYKEMPEIEHNRSLIFLKSYQPYYTSIVLTRKQSEILALKYGIPDYFDYRIVNIPSVNKITLMSTPINMISPADQWTVDALNNINRIAESRVKVIPYMDMFLSQIIENPSSLEFIYLNSENKEVRLVCKNVNELRKHTIELTSPYSSRTIVGKLRTGELQQPQVFQVGKYLIISGYDKNGYPTTACITLQSRDTILLLIGEHNIRKVACSYLKEQNKLPVASKYSPNQTDCKFNSCFINSVKADMNGISFHLKSSGESMIFNIDSEDQDDWIKSTVLTPDSDYGSTGINNIIASAAKRLSDITFVQVRDGGGLVSIINRYGMHRTMAVRGYDKFMKYLHTAEQICHPSILKKFVI